MRTGQRPAPEESLERVGRILAGGPLVDYIALWLYSCKADSLPYTSDPLISRPSSLPPVKALEGPDQAQR